MKTLAIAKIYAFPLVMFVLLLVALGIIAWKQQNINSFKHHSVEHTFIVDLSDGCGWQEMDAIQKNLEQRTHQPVYGELVDRKRQVYRIKVKAPPAHAPTIWDWLSGRKWVEKADKEKQGQAHVRQASKRSRVC